MNAEELARPLPEPEAEGGELLAHPTADRVELQKAEAREKAAEVVAAFRGRKKRATLSANELLGEDKTVMAAWARGSAALMLMNIMTEKVLPKDAAQAVAVAKECLAIAQAEGLEGGGVAMTDEQKIARSRDLRAEIATMAQDIASREGLQ